MNFYYPYLHTDPAEPYLGRSPALGIKNPEMDKLLEAMAGENNFDKRKAAFKKVFLRSQEKTYWLPYLTPVSAVAWGKRGLRNFKPEEYSRPHSGPGGRPGWMCKTKTEIAV